MPNRKSIQLVMLVAAVSVIATSCGAPEYCKKGSYPDFYAEDWKPYCAEYISHIEEPGLYELEELTAFFVRHPERVEELNDGLKKYEKGVQACFQSEPQKLEYRTLNSCLDYDDEQQLAVINAWKARIDPWIEEHELLVAGTKPRLGDAKRDAKRLMRKTEDALEFSREADPSLFEEWSANLSTLDRDIEKGVYMKEEWDNIVELTSSSKELREAITGQVEDAVKALVAEVEEQRAAHDDLLLLRRYLEFAVNSSGKVCPKGMKASKELKLAKKHMKGRLKSVKGTAPRITSKIAKSQADEMNYQTFEGFVCGDRSRENQFSEQPKLCGIYKFKMQREKSVDVRRWGNWKVVDFEESGPAGGVDCLLNQK